MLLAADTNNIEVREGDVDMKNIEFRGGDGQRSEEEINERELAGEEGKEKIRRRMRRESREKAKDATLGDIR